MIRIEDDRKIFACPARYPALVPFLMEEVRGSVDFEVYRGVKAIAEAFAADYAGRFFTPAALKAIGRALDPYLEAHGYCREKRGQTVWYRHFELVAGSAVNPHLLREDSFFLDDALMAAFPALGNATTFRPRELIAHGLPAYVTIADGKIVSVATVNENLSADAMPEMTVETAVAYRGRSYATANAAALARCLLARGKTVAYCCRHTHTASAAIARRVGFEEIGRFFAVTAYRA